MIEFILMQEHELEVGKVAYKGEGFEVIFGEIEFDKIVALVE